MKKESLLIVKSNYLIEASYKLTLNEQRLILMAVSQLKNRRPMSGQKIQRVVALNYQETFKLSQKNAYRELKSASDNLFQRDIKTYDDKGMDRFRWVECVRYEEKEGFVELHFTDSIAPYLTKIHSNFTQYELKNLSGVKSIYAIRLFEMFKRWEQKGGRYIKLTDLRRWFELQDKYKKYNDIKKRVIEPAIRELEEKANLNISWEEVKAGRKVTGFNFMFEEDIQLDMFK